MEIYLNQDSVQILRSDGMTFDNGGTVLIVDDTETNIDILLESLSDDFDLSVAMDGETALLLVEEIHPDLILLDIMMPGMDGYEVCRRLKSDSSTENIPVVFLTAMTDAEDEARGLELGALDYITKPFNPELVRARVRNQLALRRYQLKLIEQRDKIEDDYHKIKELERLRDDLVHMIAHDMRTPLTGISAYLAVVLGDKSIKPDEETARYLRYSLESAEKLNGMITNLLDVSRLEEGKMPLQLRECSLKEIIDKALIQLGGLLQGRDVNFDYDSNISSTVCDSDIIERVMVNLVGNALKFTPPDGKIEIRLKGEPHWNHITIKDNGAGIPVECHSLIFEKFGQVDGKKENIKFSSGLGLSFCKLAVDAHGGSITVESERGKGTVFHVRLPAIEEYVLIEKTSSSDTAECQSLEKLPNNNIMERKSIKVMVVDNDRHITESLKRYLEIKTEWQITEINDSGRVIRKALETKPDLIIMDIDMPGKSGTDLAEELSSVPSVGKPAIVFFTGLLSPEEAGENGVSNIFGKFPTVPKGLPLAKFLTTMTELLQKRESGIS